MKDRRRSRRLAALAGCAALTGGVALAAGVAGTAGAAPTPAQARVTAVAALPPVVASWGANGNGQLGDGTTTDRPRYTDVGTVSNVVQVAAGWYYRIGHTLAVRSDGTVWAWGDNLSGELGDGTTNNRAAPVLVTELTGVTQVAGGCAHSLALRSDGTVWAWGDNSAGELGRGTVTGTEVTPAPVAGLTGVTKIAAGCGFSLALRSDGTLWAWGYNADGELGTGTTANSAVPARVMGLSHVTGMAAGLDAAVATATNGISALTSVWTWGANDSGQLGDGTLAGRTTPEHVTGLPLYIAGVAAGLKYAAILGTDGSVWAWGEDNTGQLGNARAVAPVTRPVNTVGVGRGITQIAAGADHMVALKADGTVLAWGDNTDGELGTGSTGSVTGPVLVAGLTGVTQVAAGLRDGLAVHVPPPPPPPSTVPDLTDETRTQATQALQAAGLLLGAVILVADKYCAHPGTVISQDPAAGTAVSPGTAVSVTIGQPPPGGCP